MESTTPSKKPIVGCYVVGGDSIYLSEETIPDSPFCASTDYLQHFQQACQKLTEKLQCLVIVDHLLNDPETLQAIYEGAKKHSHLVHIFSAVGAIIQRAASHASASIIGEEKILILINIGSKYLAIVLEKSRSLLSPIDVQINSLKSLQNDYPAFSSKPVFCIMGAEMEKTIQEQLQMEFSKIKFYHFKHQLKSIVVGGFCKALCIAGPGRDLEVENFHPGIFSGNSFELIKSCSKYPVKLYFVPSSHGSMYFGETLTIRIKNDTKWIFDKIPFNKQELVPSSTYLLEYNACGLMNMKMEEHDTNPFEVFDNLSTDNQKIQVWSADKEQMGRFDFDKKLIQLTPLSLELKDLIADDLLNNEQQILQQLNATQCNLLTVLCDKINAYNVCGPTISVAPNYVGLLQYIVTLHYKEPTTTPRRLLFFVVTKTNSKIYALNERSFLCYTVSYCSNLTEMYIDQSILCGSEDVGIFYITETGSNKFLFIQPEFKNQFLNLTIKNADEATLYGGAIYAWQNSLQNLTSRYVTVDPFFDPEIDCKGIDTVSRTTSSSFYEIEAFFHGALKFLGSNLFYGDIIAVIFRRQLEIFIYFFVHVRGKFLFKFDICVPHDVTIIPPMVHYADYVIIENYGFVTRSPEIIPIMFTWPKDFNIERFVADLENDNLVLLDTVPYADAIIKAVERGIYKRKIYETCPMTIELFEDSCKIVLEKEAYLTVSGAEYIPMYLSFSSSTLRFGKDALEDLQNYPNSVIYDFLNLLGATSSTLPELTYNGEIKKMDDSEDSKLGYKVSTSNGPQIISPEIAMKIYLKKLIGIYERHIIPQKVYEIKFRLNNKILTDVQKQCLEEAIKPLKKVVSFCRY